MNAWFESEQHGERAQAYLEAGDWDLALRELDAALSVNPNHSQWHFEKGLTLEALERFEEAAACYEQVIRLRGSDVPTLLHLGVVLIEAGRYARAVEVLAQVSDLDPDCEPAWCHRIAAHAALGEHQEAEECFYRARQIVDECPHCYEAIGDSLEDRGEVDRAIWCWQQTLRLSPGEPHIYARLGRAHWHKGQLERSRQYFVQQLRNHPGDTDTLVRLGNLLRELGRHAQAASKFRQAIEIQPRMVEAHLALAELAMQMDHFESAQTHLEHIKQIDPLTPGVYMRLSQIQLRRGDIEAARRIVRAEFDCHGRCSVEALQLARHLIDLNLPVPAIALLSPMLEPDVRHHLYPALLSQSLLLRGMALLLTGDYARSAVDCGRAARLGRDVNIARHNLALAYIQMGRLDRARVCIRRLAALDAPPHQLRPLLRQYRRALARHLVQKMLPHRRRR